MRSLLCLLAAGLLLLPGCLDALPADEPPVPGATNATSTESAPADPEPQPADQGAQVTLDRSNLTKHRIVLANITDGWEAVRIPKTPQVWDVPETDGGYGTSLYLGVVARGSPGATVYLGDVLHRPGRHGDTYAYFYAYEGEGPHVLHKAHSYSCFGDCGNTTPPREDWVIVAGAMDGSVQLEVGLLGGRPASQADVVQRLDPRPRMAYGPNATGQAGMAGTYYAFADDQGPTRQHHAGLIEVSGEATAELPRGGAVQRHRRIQANTTLPTDGTAAFLATTGQANGVNKWNLSYQIPPWKAGARGEVVHAEGFEVAGDSPLAWGTLLSLPGPAGLEIDETFTHTGYPYTPIGVQETLVTWGWVDRDLWQAFDWRVHQITLPRPADGGPGAASAPLPSTSGSQRVTCPFPDPVDRCTHGLAPELDPPVLAR